MEKITVKIFTIQKGDARVEWFKTLFVDGVYFNEDCVKYNDREFYESLLQLFQQWMKARRPGGSICYPNKLICYEVGFMEYINKIIPDLKITNNVAGKF